MQLVRCEACGARALVAASQCPQCANPFYLRNAKGTIALSHCRACGTYYPRSRGGCKWCGTTSRSIPALVLLVAGVLATAGVIAFGVWQYRARRDAPPAPAQSALHRLLLPADGPAGLHLPDVGSHVGNLA